MSESCEIRVIKPAEAKELLNNAHDNRKIGPKHVTRIATDIEHGDWKLNGQSIIISSEGKLLDGQHRLSGCVEADKPIRTVVVTGVKKEVFFTIDAGKKRTLGDVFRVLGEANPIWLGTATNTHWAYTTALLQGNHAVSQVSHFHPTHSTALEHLEANPWLRDITEWTSLCNMTRKPVFAGVRVPSLGLAMTREMPNSVEFHYAVGHGHYEDNSPLAHQVLSKYREWLLGAHFAGTPFLTRLAVHIMAWNAWSTDTTFRPGTWTPSKPVPEFYLGKDSE